MERKTRPADDDRELEELDRAYSEITGYQPKKVKKSPKKRNNIRILLAICGLLTLVLCICLFCLVNLEHGTLFDGVLQMPDVTMAGIPMGGMSKAEAKAALQQLGDEIYSKNMTLRVMDQTLELSPAEAGLQLVPPVADRRGHHAASVRAVVPHFRFRLVRGAADLALARPSVRPAAPPEDPLLRMRLKVGNRRLV